MVSSTLSPINKTPKRKQNKSPVPFKSPPATDGRRKKEPLPEKSVKNLQFVYVNAIKSDPPLVASIGKFLDKNETLWPDKDTKRRLGKLPSYWNKGGPYISPLPHEAKEGAEYVQSLKHRIWTESNHRRMSEAESSSGESDYESTSSLKPEIYTTTTRKAKKASDPPQQIQQFKPVQATFTMSSSGSDPPATVKKSYGFSIDELGISGLRHLSTSLNQIVFVNPEDPKSSPKGFASWEDEVLVKENRAELWIKRVAVLVILDSPESAEIVASCNAKLEKDGYGFSFEVPHQDPNFVKSFEEIVEIVAKKSSKTLKDPDGTLFSNKVSPISHISSHK